MAKSSGLTQEVVSYLSYNLAPEYRGEPHRQDIKELQTLKFPVQRNESFSDLSILSVRSTIRRSISARDKQTLGRGAALKWSPRYLTCYFVCSPDKRKMSNFSSAL